VVFGDGAVQRIFVEPGVSARGQTQAIRVAKHLLMKSAANVSQQLARLRNPKKRPSKIEAPVAKD
jgi:hypothetical protein